MKTIKGAVLLFGMLYASVVQTLAVEELKVSVQCTNVVLSWPCLDDGSESFIIQYRPTLSATDTWQTLEMSLPSVWGTNTMFYTHYGVITNPVNCNGDGLAMMAISEESETVSSEPVATPLTGGDSAPVKLFPTGFDFSNFVICVPGTEGFLSGNEFMQANSIDPNDSGEPLGGGGTNTPPNIGFYRVVRVGPHMMGITNNMLLTGTVNIPLEIGNAQGELTSVSLTENGASLTTDTIHTAPFELPLPVMALNTTLLSNGIHQIAAIARWDLPMDDTNETGGGSFEVDCPPITVMVSNEISFPNWFSHFGDLYPNLVMTAESLHTNVDWYADVYGANAGYIGTFGGHTTNGNIYVSWNLVGPPPDYIEYTNEPWFQFEISTPYIDPPSPKTYKQNDPWKNGPGGWVMVAQHAFDFMTDSETLYAEIDGFIGMIQGQGLTIRPSPVNNNANAFPIRFHDDAADGDWNQFRAAVTNANSRNLVYFGHGGPNGLGYDQKNPHRSLLSKDIAQYLHTIPAGQTNRHAYRMVLVDGCSTAAGNLPESFGIAHKENVPRQEYADAGLRMQAFCGWSADKYVGFINGGAINYDHVHFIQWIQYFLASGETIKQAVTDAGRQPDVIWVNKDEFKIFGCWDLTFYAQNN
jgi:hypothetical protein